MILWVGLKYEDRIIPITKSLYAWDIHLLNQNIINNLFPNASPEFLRTIFENASLTPLLLFPAFYLDEEYLFTYDDVIVEYLKNIKLIKTNRNLLDSDFTLDILYQPLSEALEVGFKMYFRGVNRVTTNYKYRFPHEIKGKDTEILCAVISFYLYKNTSFSITIDYSNDDTLYNTIMKYYAIFGDFSNVKLGYQISFGFYDITKNKFNELGKYKLIELPIKLESKGKLRYLMQPIPVIFANVFQFGASKINFTVTKKLLSQAKSVKWLIT